MTVLLKKSLREVESVVRTVPPVVSSQNPAAYIGGGVSSYKYLGLKVPQVRAVFRNHRFSFLSGSEKEILNTWNYVWNETEIYEVACLPLMYCGETIKTGDRLAAHQPVMVKWADRIDNWAHSDSLSSIYAKILETNRNSMLPVLEEWSESENPWLRRQSVVSLLYYSSARSKVLPFSRLIKMVGKQIDHGDYYVQKGVGWALRETGNVYPDQTFDYLKKQIGKISPAAFSAATEKLAGVKKEELKRLRAKARGR